VPGAGNSFEGSPAWAPDGKTIVVIEDDIAGYRDNLIAINVENGKQTPVVSQKWFDIDQLNWLSDGTGFVLVAKENTSGYRNYQIWNVSYPKGEVSRITNDLNEYRGLSLTSDSSTIISVRLEQNSNIWVMKRQNSAPEQITHGAASLDGLWGISWTTDGRIVYTSTASGDEDLWFMTADGKNIKQLTTGEFAKIAPSCCPDGRYVVFMSRSREGTHVWRIHMEGSGMKQLTFGTSEGVPNCIDGRSLVYVSAGAGDWSLWKVSIDGGEAVQLTDKPSLSPAVSPDGKLIAYAFLDERQEKNIAIISTEGGPPIKTLPLSSTVLVDIGLGLRWTSDARALTYIDVVDDVSNIWIQPLDGGRPKQQTNFKSDEIFSYDVSRNGEIAVARGSSARDVVLIRDFAKESQRN
jgi:Tol biopolymer transport system component